MTFLLKSSFRVTEKRALLVTAERAVLYQCRNGQIEVAYEFTADEAGHATFERCLSETNAAPIYILVDIVEEEYRQDVIPHVSGADRRSVLERKFARLFRGTNYCHAITQGREKEGRKDDKVLFTAITRPDIVAPWVELIQQHKVPIAGVYSLPVLSQDLLRKINAKGTNVLLISVESTSGLRQTFFRDRKIKISRLAQMPRIGSVPYASHIMGELEKLRRYLNSLALISRDAPLQIYILSHGKWLNELEQHCRDTADEQYFLVDVADVGSRLGFKKELDTPYADTLFAQLLLDESPKNHYASQRETHYFSLYRLRNGLVAASVLLLVASMAWSGFNFLDGVSLKQQALDAQQKANFYQDRYAMARRDLPPTPVEPRDIQAAVDIVTKLRHYKSDPLPVLEIVSAAIDTDSAVQLDRIEWFADLDPNSSGETGNRRREIPSDERIERDPQYSHYHIAIVRGHLDRFEGNYRSAIELADAIAGRIAAHPDVRRATVIEYPLDVTSDANLSGNATEVKTSTQARFALKVVLGVSSGAKQS